MKTQVRRIYDDRDKAKVALTLSVNEGNKRKTARELGIPIGTLRHWISEWELNGYPEGMQDVLPAEQEDFVAQITEVRYLMIERLREKVERRELNGKDLIYGVHVLTDKINVLSGNATSRSEHIEIALPAPEELASALANYINKTIEDVNRRGEEIVDAEFTDTSKPLLALVKET